MTLRSRITLWYVGALLITLVLVCTFSFYEIFLELQEHPHHVQLGTDDYDNSATKEIIEIFATFGLPPALLAAFGGWWFLTRSLNPLTELARAAGDLTATNLSTRLPRSGNGDEVDTLAAALNDMTARLDQSFQRLRDHTRHASHELKTPLALLRAEMESTLENLEISPTLRDTLSSQMEEVERLTRIVDGLGFLTGPESDLHEMAMTPQNLDALLRDIAEDCRVLAEPRHITVSLDTCDAATVNGDADRLRQLLLNLIDNAVHYNHDAGLVRLSLVAHDGFSRLSVSNTGPGLGDADPARVFDPFWRGSRASTLNPAGCGLGLSICQKIAVQHGGTLALTSGADGMTTVTLSLPLLPSSHLRATAYT